jgi:hypothetical protein
MGGFAGDWEGVDRCPANGFEFFDERRKSARLPLSNRPLVGLGSRCHHRAMRRNRRTITAVYEFKNEISACAIFGESFRRKYTSNKRIGLL